MELKFNINKKIRWFSFIMIALIITEFYVPYKNGIDGWYMHALSISKIILCRLITFSIYRENKKGASYKLCTPLFNTLALLFIAEFLANFVLNIPFPRALLYESYIFFASALIVEFAVSSLAITLFLYEYHKGNMKVFVAIFALLCYGIAFYCAVTFNITYSAPQSLKNFGNNLKTLFIIREGLLFFLTINTSNRYLKKFMDRASEEITTYTSYFSE